MLFLKCWTVSIPSLLKTWNSNNSHQNIPECFGQRVCLVWWWLIRGLALPTFDPACMHAKALWSSPTLWTYALWPRQASLSMGFFRQEYWTGLLCPVPMDLPNPEVEAEFLISPAFAGGFFTISTTWEAHIWPYLALNTPALLPGKSHGWRSWESWSPWGRWGSDTTERLHFHFSLSCIGEGNGNPLQCSCLENPRDGGAWWAAVYGVAQSRTRLKRLSSSSSS